MIDDHREEEHFHFVAPSDLHALTADLSSMRLVGVSTECLLLDYPFLVPSTKDLNIFLDSTSPDLALRTRC